MANTNAGRKAYIAVTAPGGSTPAPQPTALDQSQFEALNWTEIGNVGSIGESGTQTNLPTYDELGTDVTQKQKGVSNAGDPVIECARNPTDLGQIAMRAAAATKMQYAFKFEDADAPSASYTNTIYYNRGVVTGPTRPNGRVEDFILENYTLGLNQIEIVVDPQPLSATANVLKPAIIGADVKTGVLLTAYPGTWSNGPVSISYQWQADDAGDGSFANISGATGATFTPVAGNVGDALRVAVTAVNGEGTPVTVYSLPTQLQTSA